MGRVSAIAAVQRAHCIWDQGRLVPTPFRECFPGDWGKNAAAITREWLTALARARRKLVATAGRACLTLFPHPATIPAIEFSFPRAQALRTGMGEAIGGAP